MEIHTLNFDGSHNNRENKSGAGCVIWDSQGEFVVAAAYNLTQPYPYNSNVAIAEAVALLKGLKLAKDRNLNLKLIKGDSTEVIDHVLGRSKRSSRPPLSGIIQQIVCMIDRVSQDIVIIRRNVNQVADKLATWGCKSIEKGGHRIYPTYAHLPRQVAKLIRQKRSFSSSRREENDEEMSRILLSMLSKAISYGNSYTLNFDGSHNNQENKSGAGCVIWDNQGEFVVAAAYNLSQAYPYNSNVAIAEAVALLNGLKLAKDHNLNLKRIEGDSTEVIDHVLGRNIRPSRPPFSGIIQQIAGMIDRVSHDIVIIDRNVNQVADKLASWGCNHIEEGGHRIYPTYAHLPPQVAGLIIRQNGSFSSSGSEENDGEGSNTAGKIALAGAAAVGIGMLAWGVSKLFSRESSSDQQLNDDHYTLPFPMDW